MQQNRFVQLITYLDLVMTPNMDAALDGTAVDDFVVELFKILGYVHRQRVARTQVDLPLLICGEDRHATTNVCIVDRSQNDMLPLVQEDRLEYGEPVDAQAQLVAEAVGAFNENNAQRESIGLPPWEEKVSQSRVC